MPSRGRRRTTLADGAQATGLAALAGLTLVLCVLALRQADASSADAGAPSSHVSPTTAAEPSTAPTATTPPPSAVKDQRRADFSMGDDLPDGSRIYDSSTSEGMAVRYGQLVHGYPAGSAGASYLETRLAADVSKLGARVSFPAGASGSIALVAWSSSVVDAARADRPMPSSGMRLTATAHGWKVTVGPDREVIGAGEFAASGQVLSFEVVRDGTDLWITDPDGTVTQMSDPRIAELAGPWACWELFETSAQQVPAAFEQIWAG